MKPDAQNVATDFGRVEQEEEQQPEEPKYIIEYDPDPAESQVSVKKCLTPTGSELEFSSLSFFRLLRKKVKTSAHRRFSLSGIL